MLPLLDLFELPFNGHTFSCQLIYIAGGLKQLNLENVSRAKPQSKYFLNAPFRLFNAYILVYAVDHNCVQLDKLVEQLLVWLEFELRHFFTESVENHKSNN